MLRDHGACAAAVFSTYPGELRRQGGPGPDGRHPSRSCRRWFGNCGAGTALVFGAPFLAQQFSA